MPFSETGLAFLHLYDAAHDLSAIAKFTDKFMFRI